MSVQNQIDRLAGAKTTLGNYLQQNGVAVQSGATLDEMALLLADVIEKQNKITASGILKGDGQGGVTAAVPGTDYLKTAPVTSINGKTGAVTLGKSDVGLGSVDNVRQYSASNPPPYPVKSVNGHTGDVTVSVPTVPSTTNILKGNGSGGVVAATRGSDYIASGNITKQTLVASESTPAENYAINWVYG